jgi:hypothetical protein
LNLVFHIRENTLGNESVKLLSQKARGPNCV